MHQRSAGAASNLQDRRRREPLPGHAWEMRHMYIVEASRGTTACPATSTPSMSRTSTPRLTSGCTRTSTIEEAVVHKLHFMAEVRRPRDAVHARSPSIRSSACSRAARRRPTCSRVSLRFATIRATTCPRRSAGTSIWARSIARSSTPTRWCERRSASFRIGAMEQTARDSSPAPFFSNWRCRLEAGCSSRFRSCQSDLESLLVR